VKKEIAQVSIHREDVFAGKGHTEAHEPFKLSKFKKAQPKVFNHLLIPAVPPSAAAPAAELHSATEEPAQGAAEERTNSAEAAEC
jgi:hypothetical protein